VSRSWFLNNIFHSKESKSLGEMADSKESINDLKHVVILDGKEKLKSGIPRWWLEGGSRKRAS
jgi:hypothetical protein